MARVKTLPPSLTQRLIAPVNAWYYLDRVFAAYVAKKVKIICTILKEKKVNVMNQQNQMPLSL